MNAANKIKLGLLFGGRSCEHQVSVISARSILNAIDQRRFAVTLIGIDPEGHWHLAAADEFESMLADGKVRAQPVDNEITLQLHHRGNLTAASTHASHRASTHSSTRATSDPPSPVTPPQLDVLFPALHGTFGEDGTIQGAFELAGIAYVGCGVAASAAAMDKILAKKLCAEAGIAQADYLAVRASEYAADADAVLTRAEKLKYPLFVKPARLGSSVGIRRAELRQQLIDAIDHAFEFDAKIVIEQAMCDCAEIECAVLGNDDAHASILGEIIPGGAFYDYQTKYLDDSSELIVPAPLSDECTARVRELAVRAFHQLDCAGLARVDFFVHRQTQKIYINELNTLPGFTPISMYPRLWAESGVPYPQLINRLIDLALDAHHTRSQLRRSL